MIITRFTQSCLLIESKDKKILIDPGQLETDESLIDKWGEIDAIFITHKHGDHCDPTLISQIMKDSNTKLYSSSEVAQSYPKLKFNIVKEGDIVKLDGINVEVVKAVHGYMPFLKGDKEINENIGYIIDNGKTRVYTTSDTISFKNNYKCDIIFVPVSNHGLVMGPFEAALFAKETEAELVVPYHYDNPKFPVSLNEVEEQFKKQNLNYKILKSGESIEI